MARLEEGKLLCPLLSVVATDGPSKHSVVQLAECLHVVSALVSDRRIAIDFVGFQHSAVEVGVCPGCRFTCHVSPHAASEGAMTGAEAESSPEPFRRRFGCVCASQRLDADPRPLSGLLFQHGGKGSPPLSNTGAMIV